MIKVRFNLGRGENFKKWKVTYPDRIEYIDPYKFSLDMQNIRLHNRPDSAKKIHEGANKFPCAWIGCQSLSKVDKYESRPKDLSILRSGVIREAKYNPRVAPNWQNNDNTNLDGYRAKRAVTFENKVYYIM